MTKPDRTRSVSIRRTAPGAFVATNVRGGQLAFGSGDDDAFTPVELLLAAIGGCSAIDVDLITGRRAQPDELEVTVSATSLRGVDGNRLDDIAVRFRLEFPAGAPGDAARSVLPDAVRKSHDRLCTVSRTIEHGPRVAMSLSGDA